MMDLQFMCSKLKNILIKESPLPFKKTKQKAVWNTILTINLSNIILKQNYYIDIKTIQFKK